MLNYDAMGGVVFLFGAILIAVIVVFIVFVGSAIMLGILLHKKRKENNAQQSVTHTSEVTKED